MKAKIYAAIALVAVISLGGVAVLAPTVQDAAHLTESGRGAEGLRLMQLWLLQWNANNKLALAKVYMQGSTLPLSREKAAHWLLAAAGAGNVEAQYLIGMAYHKGDGLSPDDSRAVTWLTRAAGQGSSGASVQLSDFYRDGIGVPKNPEKSFAWANKAAQQGSAEGELIVGLDYLTGFGVSESDASAISMISRAAAKGLAIAQVDLAGLYMQGKGVPQDYAAAADWLTKAASSGNDDAQYVLGAMYFEGQGVTRSSTKGLQLFLRAAKAGNARADSSLAELYTKGSYFDPVIDRDFVQAYAFYNIAAAKGDEAATAQRDALGQKMTPAQIALAQKLASGWKMGDSLPFQTQLRDRAPQYLIGKNFPPSLLAKTRVWFQRTFEMGASRYTAVFLATKGDGCHACEAAISVVTFAMTGGSVDWVNAQPAFAGLGAWGDVRDLDSIEQKSPMPIGRGVGIALGRTVALLFTPQGFSGQGITDRFLEVLSFQPPSGWRYVGAIPVGGDNAGTCGESGNVQDNPAAQACYKWTGRVKIESQESHGLPLIAVKASGTTYDLTSPSWKIVPAPDLSLAYNGSKYVKAANVNQGHTGGS